jgi:hypothetical protein
LSKKADPKPPAELKMPKLSESLRELSPTRSIRRAEFLSTVHYSVFSLTRGELEQIFYFADLNHDDLLDNSEWDKFVLFYVQPFEKCDTKGKYTLTKPEFKECFSKDPKSKLVKFQKKFEKNASDIMMATVSSRKSSDINFSDYLFIRRALFGWQQCQSSAKYIAKSHFKCAFQLAVPQKYQLKVNFDVIYDTGMKISNDIELTQLDFIAYLKILYSSYVFAVFGLPHNSPFLEKQQFLKAISEDRIPSFFEENEVNTLYNIISTNPLHKAVEMNFPSFCFFLSLNRLFHKHSNTRPLHLTKKELVKLLGDKLAPTSIVNAIDKAEIKFTPAAYKEASLYLQKKSPQESDFYYSFKSVDSQPEWFAHRSDVVSDFLPFPRSHMPLTNSTANAVARETFFSVMVDVDKEHWNKYTFYKAFQLSNLFVSMTTDIRYFVSVSSVLTYLPKYYDIVSPSISQNQRRNLAFYKTLPKECFLDILTFLEVENYMNKFRNTKISNINTVTETLLKIVMKDYGMTDIPDEIIDLAKTGYDKLKRRVYNSEKVMRVLMTVQSIAAELRRTKEMKKKHQVKDNKDVSRTYPLGNRRVKGSTLV